MESEPKTTRRDMEEYTGALIRKVLDRLGYNLHDDHFVKTPERWWEALQEFKKVKNPAKVLNTSFTSGYKGLVVAKGIEFSSLCAHHMLPFTGVVHIGYLPHDSIVGISKLVRLVEAVTHQITIQEEITKTLVECLDTTLKPKGSIAVVRGTHTCMSVRGVRQAPEITTAYLTGAFLTNSAGCKDEFYSIIGAQ